MALNITPLAVDEVGNGERLERVAFDRADALMMVHALSIASVTAYMCDSKVAANRLKHYRTLFMKMVPPILRKLQREEDATEIILAMDTAETWSARQEAGLWRETERRVSIIVGTKTWTTWERLTDAEFAEMEQAFTALAPLTCMKVAAEKKAAV